jgi:hypothetical protein
MLEIPRLLGGHKGPEQGAQTPAAVGFLTSVTQDTAKQAKWSLAAGPRVGFQGTAQILEVQG